MKVNFMLRNYYILANVLPMFPRRNDVEFPFLPNQPKVKRYILLAELRQKYFFEYDLFAMVPLYQLKK